MPTTHPTTHLTRYYYHYHYCDVKTPHLSIAFCFVLLCFTRSTKATCQVDLASASSQVAASSPSTLLVVFSAVLNWPPRPAAYSNRHRCTRLIRTLSHSLVRRRLNNLPPSYKVSHKPEDFALQEPQHTFQVSRCSAYSYKATVIADTVD